jgi:hypothetical protein
MEAQNVAVRVGKGATRAERRVRGVPGLCVLLLRERPRQKRKASKFRDCVLGVSTC